MKKLLLSLILLSPWSAFALTLTTVNVEFLWDEKLPHDGEIIGRSRPAPSAADYKMRLSGFVGLITAQGAHIVALQEIENCTVAQDLVNLLRLYDARWTAACKEGRDTYTGQDVTILTTFRAHPETISNFPQFSHMLKGKNIRPSKVLGVILTDPGNGETFLVMTAHLISRHAGNDQKREAQAKAIAAARDHMVATHQPDHLILMGDMNDQPHSPTLSALKNSTRFGNTASLQNPAERGVCSYTYRGSCSLIDHILIPRSLAGGKLMQVDLPGWLTNHHSVTYTID